MAEAAELAPEDAEFSPIAERVEHLMNALDADAKRTAARNAAVQPLRAKIATLDKAGRGSATVERMLQPDVDVERTYGGVQRVTEAPLDRLHRQGFVTAAEFEAGDRYRADAYLAAVEPTVGSVDWNSAGGGGRSSKVPEMFGSQVVYDARKRVRAIEDRMSGVVHVVARLALVREARLTEIGQSVFGFGDRKEAMIAGKVATRMTCAALVDLYRG